jgi:hypothetical protein
MEPKKLEHRTPHLTRNLMIPENFQPKSLQSISCRHTERASSTKQRI